MFEKEAVDNITQQFGTSGEYNTRIRIWQDGAEFGYNKANEWHNLEENPTDLPKENMKQVLVKLSDGSYEMGYYCIHQGVWYNDECDSDTLEYYYFDEKIKVVKWKEIEDD